MSAPIPILISAGEESGDLYGSLLIQGLRQRLGAVDFFGCGGERMRAAGCETLVDAGRIAMVGLVEVVPGLPRAWKAFRRMVEALQCRRPALAVLIDFPDFNLRLARKLKQAGIRVVYFIAPQAWAWRPGRVAALRQYVDRLLCIFPFEEEFFRHAGVRAEFVGHPLVGRVAPSLTESQFRGRSGIPEELPLIALLPGSRRREIALNLPPMLETAVNISQAGEYAYVLAAANSQAGEFIRGGLRKFLGARESKTFSGSGVRNSEGGGRPFPDVRSQISASGLNSGQRFFVVENHTYDAVAHASAAVVASGTATIVTALLGTPMVVVYRVTRATWWLGRRLVRTPFLSMVNLVMGRQIVPEFIQDEFQPATVARATRELLENDAARQHMGNAFRELVEKLRLPRTADGRCLQDSDAADAASRNSIEATSAAGGQPARSNTALADRFLAWDGAEAISSNGVDAIERSVTVAETVLRARFSPDGDF